MPAQSRPPESNHPQTIGRYRIIRRIGAGGMAEVFLAKSTGAEGIEKILVLKRVLPAFASSAKFTTMFVDEAKIVTRLNHPNIVQVYAFEQVKDSLLLAMEFVDGLDLGRLVAGARRRGTRLPFAVSALVCAEIAKGLHYAHGRRDDHGEALDIVHRDVSPQNVLLSYEGVVKITDFGIAKAKLITEETGLIKGKFSYMSPEQARGLAVDRRSDIYSLGIVLHELLTGRPIYAGRAGLDVLELVRRGEVPTLRSIDPTIPADLERIVVRAVAFDRDARYETSRELASELTRWLHGQAEAIDAGSIEQVVQELAPRERTSPEIKAAPVGTRAAQPAHDEPTLAAEKGRERTLRERRHAVVLTGILRGRDELAKEAGRAAAAQALADASHILSDMAYKADAALAWPRSDVFRVLLGLGRASIHDPLRAVRLSLDVLDALEGLSADLPAPLTASVGVSRGVVITHRDEAGRLVRYDPQAGIFEIAQALAERAEREQVLVAGEIFRLARRDFELEDRGVLEVPAAAAMGGPASVRTFHLDGPLPREARRAAAAALPDGGLIGRAAEIASIVDGYREVVASRRSGFVLVEGELGIGKTALVAAAVDAMDPPPTRVLRAEGTFGASEIPYAMVGDLVRDVCGIGEEAPDDEVRERLAAALRAAGGSERAALASTLGALLGLKHETNAELGGDRAQDVHRAVGMLLGGVAAAGPTVLVLDGIQWADRASLDLFVHLSRRPYDFPIFGLATVRPDERTAAIVEGMPRLELAELPVADRRLLIRRRVGNAEIPTEVADAILERAGGSPFFLLELLDSLLERGILALEPATDTGPARLVRKRAGAFALPTTLEGAVAARLEDLGPEERVVLRWLAVAGGGWRADAVAQLAGAGSEETLDSLVDRGLLQRRPDGAYAFRHAIARQVAYETIEADDRVAMHRRVASRLAAMNVAAGVGAARLARHHELAGDYHAAAKEYLRAAVAARSVYSNRESLRLYARALSLLPEDSTDRLKIHEGREQILRGMGHRREQASEIHAMRVLAERVGTPADRALAANRLVRFELDSGRTAGLEPIIEQALGFARDARDVTAEAEALRLWATYHRDVGNYVKGIDACQQALSLLGTERSRLAARGVVLMTLGILLRRTGRLREAVQAYAESLAVFRRLGIKRLQAQVLNNLGVACSSLGDFEDAIILTRASIVLDREIGDRFHLGMKLSNIGQVYAELGDVERALAYLRKAIDAHDALGDLSGRADSESSIAEVMISIAEHDAAADALAKAEAAAASTGDAYDRARERLVRADLEAALGNLEAASTAIAQAEEIARTAGLRAFELYALAMTGWIASLRGEVAHARVAAESAIDGVRAAGVMEREDRILAAAVRALVTIGETGPADEARAHAAEAIRSRLFRLRDPNLRARYRCTPVVRALLGPTDDPGESTRSGAT